VFCENFFKFSIFRCNKTLNFIDNGESNPTEKTFNATLLYVIFGAR